MAKTKISEFSATASSNTDIDSINIAEGCAPSGINDAIRELMSQLKDWQSGASNDPYVVGSSGSLTLNQGTANGVTYLNGSKVVTSGSALTFDGTNLAIGASPTFYGGQVATAGSIAITGGNYLKLWNTGGSGVGGISSPSTDTIAFGIGGSFTEGMRLTSTGLGIGTSSPSYKLDVAGNGIQVTSGAGQKVRLTDNTVSLLNSTAIASGYLSFKRADGTQKAAIGSYYNVADEGDLEFIGPTGSTNMLLNSLGNLALGLTPSAAAVGYKTFQMVDITGGALVSSSYAMAMTANAYLNSTTYTRGGNSYAPAKYAQFNGTHTWSYAAAAGTTITWIDAMTLDASGNLLVGTTSTSQTSGTGLKFITTDATNPYTAQVCTSSTSGYTTHHLYSTGAAYRFYVNGAGTVFATSTTITGISDARLKENIRDLDDGLDVVMALKPRKFDWKEGKGANIKNARGFIAQEFEAVLPDMIEEWKDPAPEGEEPYKAVNANLIPTLVKAIQEQQAIIDSLKARLDAANL